MVMNMGQLRDTTKEVLKRGGRCFKCFQPWAPGHEGNCPGWGTLPSMCVSTRAHKQKKHYLNVVHSTCPQIQKWQTVQDTHKIDTVAENRVTDAPKVPVPKVISNVEGKKVTAVENAIRKVIG